MADGYWMYGDSRLQAAAAPPLMSSVKRTRPEYGDYGQLNMNGARSSGFQSDTRRRAFQHDMPGGPEMFGYYPRDEGRVGHYATRDPDSFKASYDLYSRKGISSYGAVDPARPATGGMTGRPVDDPRMMGVAGKVGFGGGRPEAPLPPDASNTLFVEGLPADCTRREVSHIFRPFVGFREVRLVSKESRPPGGDPFVLCFADFSTPSQAAVALDALQGYKLDEHEGGSASLRLQFARFPGPRSTGGGPRGRR